MKNINLQKIKDLIKNVFSRFPVPVIIIFISSVLMLIYIYFRYQLSDTTEDYIERILFSFLITFFFSLGVYLSTENKVDKKKNNLFQIIPILFGIFFFITFDLNSDEDEMYFILSLFGIISYLFFAPYIGSKKLGSEKLKLTFISDIKQNIFYSYFYNMSVIFLISFVLGGFLAALGSIGIGVIKELFELKGSIDDKLFSTWFVISLMVITPLFALNQIPNKKETLEDSFIENKFFTFLIKYVSIPFIIFYFVILYIYSLKVLINFGDWPNGEVTWMVIGFSIFGYITYILSYAFENKNKFIKKFRKIFPYVVIPQIFMLFYAISLRINQYDVTINRYFVVTFGIILLILSLYYIFSKSKKIIIIPLVLFFTTIFISIGPWSVYSLPEERQFERLKQNLISANILQNGKIVPLKSYYDISEDLGKEIYSGINYLCDFEDFEKIKELFPVIYRNIEFTNINNQYRKKWDLLDGISEKIKVKSYYNKEKNDDYIYNYNNSYHKIEMIDNIFPIDMKGYSKIDTFQSSGNSTVAKNSGEKDNYYSKIILEIIDDNNNDYNSHYKNYTYISLTDIGKEISNKYYILGKQYFTKKDLTFEIEQNSKKYKIIFKSMEIRNPDTELGIGKESFSYEGYILY